MGFSFIAKAVRHLASCTAFFYCLIDNDCVITESSLYVTIADATICAAIDLNDFQLMPDASGGSHHVLCGTDDCFFCGSFHGSLYLVDNI